jgi:NTP pyrophosphatase (non-canonical NTP hydrolase)|tara:strand:- start:94 stop:453 length:360 start_codon:yes stop_codon:yes gene_type:complete
MNRVEREHEEMVGRLSKEGSDIINSLTPQAAHLWHMASALCGEAGELFDAIKKSVIYEKDLDLENVLEELGDIEFYMQGLRSSLEITRLETLARNILKLDRRYGQEYSNNAAKERADKV